MRVGGSTAPFVCVIAATALTLAACASPASTTRERSQPTTAYQAKRQRPVRRGAKHPVVRRAVPRSDLPRLSLTPGVTLSVTSAQICVPGYATAARNVPASESDAVYVSYGVAHVPFAHEVDHLISLQLGG